MRGAGDSAARLAAEEGRAQTMTHDYKSHGTTTEARDGAKLYLSLRLG